MTVTLTKGGNLRLADEAPGIAQVRIGLGWRAAPGSDAVEIDGFVSLGQDGSSTRSMLTHQVPNPDEPVAARPGVSNPVGDAERLVVTLAAVPPGITRLSFGAAIYDAAGRHQTFRSVHEAYVRVLDHSNGIEIARYTLDVEVGSETSMVFGELYRNPRGWKFRAVGQGYAAGLRGIVGEGEPEIARPVEVTDFLRRISPARSRRSFTEHLHPPVQRAQPAPVQPTARPTARPQPAASQPAASQPTTSQPTRPQPTGAPAQPSRPPSPAARPAVPAPPSRPATASRPAAGPAPSPPTRPAAPSRSMLDLSPPDAGESPPATDTGRAGRGAAGGGRAGAGRGSSVDFGEHSSRRRQREEHVSVLDDAHPATTWTGEKRGSGGMTITLRWEPLKTSAGLPRPSDLHLGALWQAADRSEGVLQTLGNTISAPGAAGPRQVLRLGRRDEREGQTIFVDLATLPSFRRVFVFAYGQHGSPEWELLRPELVVTAPSGESLTMRLAEGSDGARLCVVASFHVVEDDLVLRRENDCVEGVQADAAARYGWNLEWNPDGMTVRSTGRASF